MTGDDFVYDQSKKNMLIARKFCAEKNKRMNF